MTLIEMLISLTLATFACGLALSIVTRQQRVSGGMDDMMAVREPLRDATSLLTAALRSMSVTGDTLQLATDTAIELDMAIGTSTLCAPVSGVTLSLPPDTLASGATLTAWLTTPDTGDYTLVFHDSSAAAPTPGWERLRIQNVTQHLAATTCPPPSPFVTAADLAAHAEAYTVTLATLPSSAVHTGAPVRFVRRARYSVYLASDRQWYLGYRRCATTCDVIQPASGPYQGGSTPPITFQYYRSDGSLLSPNGPTTGVARIALVARAQSAESLQLPGVSRMPFSDSAVTSVAVRNR
jgi:hypothetical protein